MEQAYDGFIQEQNNISLHSQLSLDDGNLHDNVHHGNFNSSPSFATNIVPFSDQKIFNRLVLLGNEVRNYNIQHQEIIFSNKALRNEINNLTLQYKKTTRICP